MAETENIELYRRLIEDEGVGPGTLQVLDEVLSPDIELPTVALMAEATILGLKQLNAGSSRWRSPTPGRRSWRSSRAETRLRPSPMDRDPHGEFLGMPPTGSRSRSRSVRSCVARTVGPLISATCSTSRVSRPSFRADGSQLEIISSGSGGIVPDDEERAAHRSHHRWARPSVVQWPREAPQPRATDRRGGAFGAICLATGRWVAADYGMAGYATGWTGYAPLAPRSSNVLSPTDLLVVWIGLALIWGAVSTYPVEEDRSSLD